MDTGNSPPNRKNRSDKKAPRSGGHTKNQIGGFTLLETTMALMILAGGILLLVNSWGSTAKRIRKMELNHQVAALLEEKMAEFETEFSDQPIEAIPDEDNDDFGAKYPNFSWKMKSRELEFPDMSAAIIAEGGADQMMVQMVKSLTEVLKTHVREVQFTIVVKTPKKNLEYSATTYFVDFNKEIAIGL